MQSGGTVGEQLVVAGVVTDEVLTDFYRKRLLVPQVNPNTLAKLPATVVRAIPNDVAVELRAVPVSLDSDNNLTVAMSDPSDRHAVDEIASHTGAYVVRAVATQMQIAWCLAHYYGHVTPLGERLLKPEEANVRTSSARKKGVTEQVKQLRTKRLERGAMMASDLMAELAAAGDAIKVQQAAPETDGITKMSSPLIDPPTPARRKAPAYPDAEPTQVQPVISNEDAATPVDTPRPRARTASGEIRIPEGRAHPRAPSIRPEIPEDTGPIITIEADARDSAPVITIEASSRDSDPVMTIEVDDSRDEDTAPKLPVPKRKRPAEPDPPELAARAGEVQLASGESIKAIDFDVLPSIMISDELERALRPSMAGEVRAREHRDSVPPPSATISVELQGTESGPAIIRETIHSERSEPVLLVQPRTPVVAVADEASTGAVTAEVDPDDEISDVVMLETKKPVNKRIERITQVGIGPVTAATLSRTGGIGADGTPVDLADDSPTDARRMVDVEDTKVDAQAAPPREDDSSDDHVAAPPPPSGTIRDTMQVPIVPPPQQVSGTPPPSGAVSFENVKRASTSVEDEDEDEIKTKPTMVMSAIELDDLIPDRTSEPQLASDQKVVSGEIGNTTKLAGLIDDGWGETIPPPLLGAIPGSLEPQSGIIPLPDMDSAPLMVAPPSPPEATNRPRTASDHGAARVLEESTASVLELIRTLEHATQRDQVIAVMIAHLAETHQRAGFFAARNNELSLFAILPRVPAMPVASLRLDRASTLQDVVGTRLPYRGPMHDDASRVFLQSTLGACPPELLLVPISVRERIVGVLFGDHRMKHTFDDQLALAARAAGMALERILKARRG